jgi:hypothetical protein
LQIGDPMTIGNDLAFIGRGLKDSFFTRALEYRDPFAGARWHQ